MDSAGFSSCLSSRDLSTNCRWSCVEIPVPLPCVFLTCWFHCCLWDIIAVFASPLLSCYLLACFCYILQLKISVLISPVLLGCSTFFQTNTTLFSGAQELLHEHSLGVGCYFMYTFFSSLWMLCDRQLFLCFTNMSNIQPQLSLVFLLTDISVTQLVTNKPLMDPLFSLLTISQTRNYLASWRLTLS